MTEAASRRRVLCLGNDLIADDGAGPAVAAALRRLGVDAEVDECDWAGLGLLDFVVGIDILVVVDVVATGSVPPGTVRLFTEDDLASAPAGAQHGLGLFEVVGLARSLGLDVPGEVAVVAIEAGDLTSIGAPMSGEVAAAVPVAAGIVGDLLATPTSSIRDNLPAMHT
jgi:hydrogenase maturation protease